ncbi:MAG: aldo/keto reductase [Segniliparus sp.]|uniref:aldo/keto reductase n=1 Tax=Segniliparus sp. TaxID=2804064 RepID=UPI003F2C6FC7
MSVPVINLNDGTTIPQLGFGVWQVPDDVAEPAVAKALEVGYRHIDTAAVYNNERGVGRAVAKSGVPREELYVTTKLWNVDQGYDSALKALDASLERLGLDYVDLYLIHWPTAAHGKFVDAFKAFQQAKADGKIRSIGVSNFHEPHLRQLVEAVGETPSVNQIELHPHFAQTPLRELHRELGIATEAYSPLGVGKSLSEPAIEKIAAEAGVTPAQAIIRWHIQVGNIVIPKSQTPERIASNFDVFGFELTPAQVDEITNLPEQPRLNADPDELQLNDRWPYGDPNSQ